MPIRSISPLQLYWHDALKSLPKGRWPLERFVLDYGLPFRAGALPPGLRRGPAQKCFQNAGRLAFNDSDYVYAEGYVWRQSSGLPFLHAWCVHGGAAVDLTLKDATNYDYLGILIPTKLLKKVTTESGYWGILESGGGVNLQFLARWKKSHVKKWRGVV